LEEDNEIQRLWEKNSNISTCKSTKTWLKRLEVWLQGRKSSTSLFQLGWSAL